MTVPCRTVKVTLEVGCADEVDDDVDAFSICGFQDFCGPVLGVVVES